LKLPFHIGKNSLAEQVAIDLSTVPLLMISIFHENQLTNLFSQFAKSKENYFLTNSRKLKKWGIDRENNYIFVRDTPEIGNVSTRSKIVRLVLIEIKKRNKVLQKNKINSFTKYYALNTWNRLKLDYQFLIIDDVWDLVTAKPQKTALNFMMILLYGPSVGIHIVFASGLSYRNLLQQLVIVHPELIEELQRKYGKPEPQHINNLGHELILTADDLVYYKKLSIMEMQKLYKLD
jgi:hypothetical protein